MSHNAPVAHSVDGLVDDRMYDLREGEQGTPCQVATKRTLVTSKADDA